MSAISSSVAATLDVATKLSLIPTAGMESFALAVRAFLLGIVCLLRCDTLVEEGGLRPRCCSAASLRTQPSGCVSAPCDACAYISRAAPRFGRLMELLDGGSGLVAALEGRLRPRGSAVRNSGLVAALYEIQASW